MPKKEFTIKLIFPENKYHEAYDMLDKEKLEQ